MIFTLALSREEHSYARGSHTDRPTQRAMLETASPVSQFLRVARKWRVLKMENHIEPNIEPNIETYRNHNIEPLYGTI